MSFKILLDAVKENHESIVEILLKYGADPNNCRHFERPDSSSSRETPLKVAFRERNVRLVKALLSKDANSNIQYMRRLILFEAIDRCEKQIGPVKISSNPNGTIALLLIEHGAVVNVLGARTPLVAAASRGLDNVVSKLLDSGAKINEEPYRGYGARSPALKAASTRNRRSCANILMDRGASTDGIHPSQLRKM